MNILFLIKERSEIKLDKKLTRPSFTPVYQAIPRKFINEVYFHIQIIEFELVGDEGTRQMLHSTYD